MQGGGSGVVASGLVVAEPEIADGLMLLVRKLVICTSVRPSAYDLQAISTKSEYYQELRHDYVSEQVVAQQLSDFIEKGGRSYTIAV